MPLTSRLDHQSLLYAETYENTENNKYQSDFMSQSLEIV